MSQDPISMTIDIDIEHVDLTEEVEERGGDPQCLHCLLVALVEHYVEAGCADPVEAVLKVAAALGTLLHNFPPSDQEAAFDGVIEIICHHLDTKPVLH